MNESRAIATNRQSVLVFVSFLIEVGCSEFAVRQIADNQWEIVAKSDEHQPESLFNQ